VADDEVIQLGGRILDKPAATVGAVSLEEFENGRRAEEVEHNRENVLLRTLILPRPPWLPAVEAPEKVISRARWLVANHPPGRYHQWDTTVNMQQTAARLAGTPKAIRFALSSA
jgi:hypothetical protein